MGATLTVLARPSLALVPPDPRARAFELVKQHGRDTVAFQALETGFRYWFDRDDAVVAYSDTGSAWVAGGGPIAPADRIAEVAREYGLGTPTNLGLNGDSAGRIPTRAWYEQRYLPTLDALTKLDIERILVTHGEPVLRDGARALAASLSRPPWRRSSLY